MGKTNFSLNSFKISKKTGSSSKPAEEFTASKKTSAKAEAKAPAKKKRTSLNLDPALVRRAQMLKLDTGTAVQDAVAEALDAYLTERGY